MSEENTILISKEDVWAAVRKLRKDRADFQKKVMDNFDKRSYAVLKAIQTRCNEIGGHEWKFMQRDIVDAGYWEVCDVCGQRRHCGVADSAKILNIMDGKS